MGPELDRARIDPVAAPERRQRHVFAGEPFLDLGDACVELFPAAQRLRLARRPGRELASSRPRLPVGARLLVARLLDGAFDTHLPAELPPVDDRCGSGVAAQLLALP